MLAWRGFSDRKPGYRSVIPNNPSAMIRAMTDRASFSRCVMGKGTGWEAGWVWNRKRLEPSAQEGGPTMRWLANTVQIPKSAPLREGSGYHVSGWLQIAMSGLAARSSGSLTHGSANRYAGLALTQQAERWARAGAG